MKKEEAKEKAKTIYQEIQGGVNEVIKQIRNLIKEGSARKLIIKDKEGEIKFQTQLAFGVSGAALIGAMAPVISAIGMFAMFINDYQIIVEREVTDDDEYSVDAEFIDIKDEDEAEEEKPKAKSKSKKEDSDSEEEEEKEEKTVGKKKK
ncbi:MAG: DUF4342 domain-containing protein [Gracilimonas sp.]|uniref:DUF4342 domain-containing protein n=1 Tax=Gracilimonas TaxID=649462 RepID=UPI001B006893|nr:DUF4342 domain-containing protein [Gracilimonas sp.]MBO6587349.1 DUF4342 domain-containing protein [Gracilimonas sp.]MBO6614165.1 DUF4342 domain-containing protein [Gracilimonas sp.]